MPCLSTICATRPKRVREEILQENEHARVDGTVIYDACSYL